ncbi:MAG: succinylglutamate desuccinylase/aspartoacylase family protein [bacterium]
MKSKVFNPRPGTKECQRFVIAENAYRQEIFLSFFGIYGRSPGPNLLLCSAVHGNEVVGVEVIRKLVEKIDPHNLHGNILAIPVVNPMGFNFGDRWDPFDRQDMNRIFPGDKNGTLTERVAHFFFESIIPYADYIIDLHSAEFPDEMIPHIRLRTDSGLDEEFKRLINSTGINTVWQGPPISGMLQVEAAKLGIHCLTIEIGAAGLINSNNVKVGLSACENVMKILGMIKGVAKIPRFQIILKSNEEWIRSPSGGIFKPDIHLGHMVRKGQKIGDVIDPTSFSSGNILSSLDGIVTGITHQPIIRSGTRLCMIVHFDNEQKDKHFLQVNPSLPNMEIIENSLWQTIKKLIMGSGLTP